MGESDALEGVECFGNEFLGIAFPDDIVGGIRCETGVCIVGTVDSVGECDL